MESKGGEADANRTLELSKHSKQGTAYRAGAGRC